MSFGKRAGLAYHYGAVLFALATRLSRCEIGPRLYVLLNTVKTHQRVLYRKLGVENRIAAVKRARELGRL